MKTIYLLPLIALSSTNAFAMRGDCEAQVKAAVAAFASAADSGNLYPEKDTDPVLFITKAAAEKVIISNEKIIDETGNDERPTITETADVEIKNSVSGTVTVRYNRGGCWILGMKI